MAGSRRIAIVGGGIAGLAVAYHLTRTRAGSVTLLEREPLVATHSSARNAAIFRPLETDPDLLALALRNRRLLEGIPALAGAWLRRTGGLFVAAEPAALAPLAEAAHEASLAHRLLDADDLKGALPVLGGGEAGAGLLAPDVGVIDIHRVTSTLEALARAGGAAIETGRDVTGIRVRHGRVEAVALADGDVAADAVVIAAGAWAASLGASCGAGLALTPLRRHLAYLEAPGALGEAAPVVWRVDGDEVYFREESGGVLASPCDEVAWAPCLPPHDGAAWDAVAAKLAAVAPGLLAARPRRLWACLRTFAPDRRPVVGPDPAVAGLYWCAGLGGFGMTTGLAAGEIAAATLGERAHPLARFASPARLQA